jgi:NitT/TauT family transport system ATP-binding protein
MCAFAVEARGLTVRYGRETALRDVSFGVEENTTCAVIGRSGCGKTTLLCALAGLLTPVSGEIFIGGQALAGVRGQTALVLQDGGLLPWKSVFENVAFALRARRIDREAVRERTLAALDGLGLLPYRGRLPGELSGGQRQRTAMRALALEPDLLLMDEAGGALDAITREQMQELILGLFLRRPMTVVFATHDIGEAVFLGQRILIMRPGGIARALNNPFFAAGDCRSSPGFSESCRFLRACLNEEN